MRRNKLSSNLIKGFLYFLSAFFQIGFSIFSINNEIKSLANNFNSFDVLVLLFTEFIRFRGIVGVIFVLITLKAIKSSDLLEEDINEIIVWNTINIFGFVLISNLSYQMYQVVSPRIIISDVFIILAIIFITFYILLIWNKVVSQFRKRLKIWKAFFKKAFLLVGLIFSKLLIFIKFIFKKINYKWKQLKYTSSNWVKTRFLKHINIVYGDKLK
ncbi:hypothetical protein SHELI_v1c08940 [Spiroplasma helicoides]|uniref:Transmembrane protein n=1 Tax=Spiroplasma helicoides TaxID=216938 RepID=A0A1B3SLP5_9MOLU|nr:hypothetical protein SHELI_v1c08940 [Spiroplasma helicoides]